MHKGPPSFHSSHYTCWRDLVVLFRGFQKVPGPHLPFPTPPAHHFHLQSLP